MKPDGTRQPLLRLHRPDYQLVLHMGLLVLIGLIVLFAISPYQINLINSGGGSLDQGHYMFKQIAYLAAGVVTFGVASVVPMSTWRRYAPKILLLAFGLCLLLAILGAASIPPALCHNGGCRWFNVGFGTFQPAELLKFGIMLFVASFLARRIEQKKVSDMSDTLIPLAVVLGAALIIVIGFQKDMGTGLTLVGCVAAMLFVAGLSKRLLVVAVGALVCLGIFFIMFSPHRITRVTTFLNHAPTSEASSYHIEMASIAIGSGGIFGRGLGNGVQAFGYLPEALNDSIFAVLGETFGFLGLIVVIGLFTALLYRIIEVALHIVDPMMKLLVIGVFGWMATHVVINIGAMIGVIPLTGVTLPFLSFGGTSLLFMMAGMGIVYHISRFTTHQNLTSGGDDESTRGRRRVGRPRYASSGRY